MRMDEDVGVEGDGALQTDDVENPAERVYANVHEDDKSSESESSSSTNCLELNDSSSWPQSYRESMDMLKGITPPSIISSPKGTNITGTSSFGDYQSNDDETSLGKSLISEPTLDEEVSISTLSASLHKVSFHGSMPSMKKCSFAQALVNGINVLTGIGLLTTPYAVKEGGWMSIMLLMIFGVVACYTGILLKRCLESSPGLQTYPDIGQAAFGVPGRLIIAVTLYAELYAGCVEYVIIMSDNLSTIFPNTSVQIGGIYLNAHQIFGIIGILIVLPTVWLRDLSLLSYLSVGGIGASIFVVLCLLWVGAVDQIGFHQTGTALNLANLPISVGIYSFCYAGHSVFPNIYSSMKEPSLFPLVLIISFIFCWFICTGAAISGFLIFGDSVESQFTLNMPIKFAASKIAVWTVVIITISKYALTLTPVALSLEELVPSTLSRSYNVSVLIRTALVISTLVVAMTVPFFAFLMALAGSLLSVLITIIFPCACYISILGGRLTNLQMAICICIAILGFLMACDGTYSAVIRIAGQR
ncbi:hypothetical protein V6N13_041434 [Hibiscus sabdariffa]|uniref:Amino acid transporter transmembrane domain-containing protein n=1 Tax=Hibiscus sabdariffa TaxID=183260 RepID=A0ABR2RB99_9ROSI